jgi:hypothetical protein
MRLVMDTILQTLDIKPNMRVLTQLTSRNIHRGQRHGNAERLDGLEVHEQDESGLPWCGLEGSARANRARLQRCHDSGEGDRRKSSLFFALQSDMNGPFRPSWWVAGLVVIGVTADMVG